MTILRKLIIAVLFSSVLSKSDDLVDYYVKLIQSEIQRSETFHSPTNAQDSKPFTNNYYEYGIFDHIVIGAGSAGGIVASRLSEDSFRKVLLLEAGGYETNFTEIPGMMAILFSSEYSWNYYTVPQTTSCLGMVNKQCTYMRGKILGGCSAINAAVYTKGCKRDFNNWCAEGNPGWCYEDVLPFFKKFEHSNINGDPFYHGSDGYINIEYPSPNTIQQRAFIEGNIELNRSFVEYNGFRQEGVGITQLNHENGRRASTANTLLKEASNRENLKILTGSHVIRILISKKSKKAYGVLFAKNNQYYVARSRKDIVLSAGSIGSPQLLMLSGIGPKHHLEDLEIPVIQELSVGENLQDHVGFSMLHFETNFPEPFKTLKENVIDYLNGVGELTNTFNTKGIAFIRTNLTKIDDFADIELLLMRISGISKHMQKLNNYDNEAHQFGWPTGSLSNFFSILMILMHPESRGYLKLKSSNPFDYPLIDPQLLSDPNFKDIETMYEGILLTLKLLDTEAFKKLGVKLYHIHLPACKIYEYLSKDYWYCHLRQVASTNAHIVGTCKMGPDPLHGAVVNHELKVYGIHNLRVADASIMPLVPGAHTNAAAMMIGEKAAHMIRELQ
ncbi:hypothetical protein RN001_003775 [Aquatica leii]|uniref:Glucose-methanol-choline oxidoreductase N-terminal domain-containing protein n=1 Tax=Aquatica leii TaxID=1421715 RepID=A0AAN7SMH4_9COLE|nr:hypothetical protein RN001_003775 [Aquatica leii]